jgi:hypothetical protein
MIEILRLIGRLIDEKELFWEDEIGIAENYIQ